MFLYKTLVGLDIGSNKIKLVELTKSLKSVKIKKYGCIDTPKNAVDGGYIINPELVGEKLGQLVHELGLKGKKTVSAVGGQQVYTRTMTMPHMDFKEIRAAASYQAMNILPINIEEATIDVYPLRDLEDEEGKKKEVFFVATRREQVDNLYEACVIAGLKLRWVEIEPLALRRVFPSQIEDIETSEAILQIGASKSYVAIYKGNIMYSMRSVSFGSDAVFTHFQIENPENVINDLCEIDASKEENHYLFRDLLKEVSRSIEYYLLQFQNEDIKRVILAGGGARVKKLEKYLSNGLNIPVEKVNLPNNIVLPSGKNDQQIQELIHEYSVAIGLALREGN